MLQVEASPRNYHPDDSRGVIYALFGASFQLKVKLFLLWV
jgi:hypothetical protein